MKCEEVQFILGRYVDGELDREETIAVEEHAYRCRECAEKIKMMHAEADLLKSALSADVEPQIETGLWERLNRARKLKTFFVRTALAAAACVIFAIIIQGVPEQKNVRLARVITCSGPLEINRGEGWGELGAYSFIRHGDKLRCGSDSTGGIILNANRRIDLDTDSEITFLADTPGSFKLDIGRGRIHGEFVNLPEPVIIDTPLGEIAIRSEYILGGRAEFELELLGGDEQTAFGWLDPVQPAYAATELTLQVFVYEGTATVTTTAGRQADVTKCEKIFVRPAGIVLGPEQIEPTDRIAWWPMPEPRPVVARAPVAPAPVVFKDQPEPPAITAEPGPPPPDDIAAVPDMDAVLVTWRPVPDKKIEAYLVYRRAVGEADFTFAGKFPVLDKVEKYIYADAGVPVSAEYEYAVTSAWRDEKGELKEGPKSAAITGVPGNFVIKLVGGDAMSATIAVEKFDKDTQVREAFNVRPRNLAGAETGDIGGARGSVGREGVVDFSTGYHLVEIIAGRDGSAEKIIIENNFGIRREINK